MTCAQVPSMSASATRSGVMSFLSSLRDGELLTGTPTVTASPAGLTFTNKALNTQALTVNGVDIIAGQGVQWSVSGGTAGVLYTITVSCGTDSTPAETLVDTAFLQVVT